MRTTDFLNQLITEAFIDLKLPPPQNIVFEKPTQSNFGDLSTNIAMVLFSDRNLSDLVKPSFNSPFSLAEAIAQTMSTNYQGTTIALISASKPGFINIAFTDHFILNQVAEVVSQPESLLKPLDQLGTVIVEFSSPNIAKPFTVGHLRSTIIGEAIASILAAKGATVLKDNHLGDWGTQFGKQIYAIKTWGNEIEIANSPEPVKKLVELYVKFHQEADLTPALEDEARAWFVKLEQGNPEARRLWKSCIDWSWTEFNQIYQALGVTFTENDGRGYGESFFEDKMQVVINQLESNPAVDYRTGEDGAKLVFFPNDQYPPLMILKKDGSTLYATRDLATDYFRLQQYGSQITVLNEVGAEQALYFKQLYAIEEMLGWYKAGQRVHIKHGLYRFKDQKMSTRKGNTIWLTEVLKEAKNRAEKLEGTEKIAGNADVIGLGALKWNDLKRSSYLDIIFDWDEVLSMQGNSGPYMLYTVVRCQSILIKAAAQPQNTLQKSSITKYIDTLLYTLTPSEKELAQLLTQFDDVVTRSAQEYSPHHIATYLYALAQSFNSFYAKHQVLGEAVTLDERAVRLLLTEGTLMIIKKGLELLGIATVGRM